jgi:hypothetical protein
MSLPAPRLLLQSPSQFYVAGYWGDPLRSALGPFDLRNVGKRRIRILVK